MAKRPTTTAAAKHAAEQPAKPVVEQTSSTPAAVQPDPGPAASERAAEDADAKAKAAAAETAKAADEGRLPETGAVTNPAPATQMESPSGAFIEQEIKDAIPVDHPAVDNNPRAGTSAVQNGADFNDPFMNDPNSPDFVGQGIDRSVYGGVQADKK